ncbi:MAG: nucleoside triphosphate pyrophosphohydrolase [Acidobacteriaceae bacterium]
MGPTTEEPAGPEATQGAFAQAVSIMARLRAPDGCPWDREQDFTSIQRYTVEETYEVLDAIDRQHWPDLKDELGDLLLQVLFYAQLAQEAGHFTLLDVLNNLNTKLVRRHPHVFGALQGVKTPEEVMANWDVIKQEEKSKRSDHAEDTSLLDGVLRSLPALIEAEKLGKKAARVGFDWPNAEDVLRKLDEELAELRSAITSKNRQQQEEEIGDLLFTVVNLSRKMEIDAEFSLRAGNAKFRRRFSTMERLAAGGKTLGQRTPEELEQLWDLAKKMEGPTEKT